MTAIDTVHDAMIPQESSLGSDRSERDLKLPVEAATDIKVAERKAVASFFRFRWAFVGVAKLWLRDQHLLAYVIEVLFVNAKRGAVTVGVSFVLLMKKFHHVDLGLFFLLGDLCNDTEIWFLSW